MLKFITSSLMVLSTLLSGYVVAQSHGPNSPTQQSTNGGGNNWFGNGGVFQSDNSRTIVSQAGFSRNLKTKKYGFSLLPTDIVSGIQLDVERRSTLGDPISIVTPWKSGSVSKINNFNISSGQNRTLIVFIGTENGHDVSINKVTIGGVQLTRLLETSYETSFWAHTECWYLKEADLASLAPGNYNITATYNAYVNNEFFDILSAALFDNVDQGDPFFSNIESTVNGGGANSGFGTQSITAGAGGMYLTNIFCGNNTSPSKTSGQTGTFQINNGFTEGVDIYISNIADAPTSGGCMQTAHKFAPLGGSESPTFTFNGGANRRLAIGIGLRKVSTIDANVRILKNGSSSALNLASTSVFWPTNDEYVTYGGATELWGETWTSADINKNSFGALIAVQVFNGTAEVDHMRLTVYSTSILPVELINFSATLIDDKTVSCDWATGSEKEIDYFDVEKSTDGFEFNKIGGKDAAGTSNTLLTYNFEDKNPTRGLSYYRLKTVDFNGIVTYSDIKQIEIDESNNSNLIYPNPVLGWAQIKASEGTTIAIVSRDGKVIDSSDGYFFNEDYHFNVSNYPNGVYYLILTENGENTVKTFVKQSN